MCQFHIFGIYSIRNFRKLILIAFHKIIYKLLTQLIFGFDPEQSNALRLPAFVLLLHRFIESVQREIVGPESANFETWQPLEIAQPGGKIRMRAPDEPGFFEAGTANTRLSGATHFADARQSDFRTAASHRPGAELASTQAFKHSRPDPLTPLWLLLLGTVMIWNWVKTEEKP